MTTRHKAVQRWPVTIEVTEGDAQGRATHTVQAASGNVRVTVGRLVVSVTTRRAASGNLYLAVEDSAYRQLLVAEFDPETGERV